MQNKVIKSLSLILACLMLLSFFVACGNTTEGSKDTTPSADSGAGEEETKDAAQEALDAIGEISWGGEEFGVLYSDRFEDEIVGLEVVESTEGGADQVINDAVFKRNTYLEELCDLKFTYIEKGDAEVNSMATNEAAAPTGDFQMIDATLRNTATALATTGKLYDLKKMNVDLEGDWWDSGTADFLLNGGVYFMSGANNIGDDKVTYVLIFNKTMRKTYANTIENPYDTVRAQEWTLDYFNGIIQGISSDSNGDGEYDELDTYGFVATWEYGNTFFIGSDLRYVLNDETVDAPALYLNTASNMERALNVLTTSCSIYHDNNATFRVPAGEEDKGITAFKENRGMFLGEVWPTCKP